jgi:hypothetical protein
MGVALSFFGFAVVLLIENRELRAEARSVRAELSRVQDQARASTEDREAASAELAAQRGRVEELSAALTSMSQEATDPDRGTSVRLPVQSHRVRAYLGNKEIGMAWLVPNKIRTNAVDGQVSYEPVIVLDDAVLQRFGATQPQMAEREVTRATTVNYYPQVYPSGWPIYWRKPQRPKDPDQSDPPPGSTPPERPPQVASPLLSTRLWHPENGWRQAAPGRPGGEWISSGTGSRRTLTAPANPARSSPFPERY